MIESIIVDEVIKLLNKNIEELDIADIAPIDYTKKPEVHTINEIDIFFKKKINALVLQYGLIGVLIRLQNLSGILASFPNNKDVDILLIGTNLLYERINNYYSSIVYARLVKWLPRLTGGTLIEEEILDDVKTNPYNERELLSINLDDYEQTTLFSVPEDQPQEELFRSINAKNNIEDYVISIIKKNFTESEFADFLTQIKMTLSFDISPESDVFLRALKDIQSKIYKSSTRKRRRNTDQLKLAGF